MIKVKKYLRKGYKAYLASVVEERKEGVKLKELPVVNEFEDVFPDDLPGLLLERERLSLKLNSYLKQLLYCKRPIGWLQQN